MMALLKNKIGLATISAFALFFLSCHFQTAQAEDPNTIEPSSNFVVTDHANVLSDQTKQAILKQEQTFKKTKEQPQVAVLTINNTDGQSIRDFTNSLTMRSVWHAGKKGQDNGVIIVFAKNNGQNNVRVVTGTGVESVLPDGKIYQLLQANQQELKSSDPNAIDRGIRNLFLQVEKTLPTTQTSGKQSASTTSSVIALGLITILLLIIFLVWSKMRRLNGSKGSYYGTDNSNNINRFNQTSNRPQRGHHSGLDWFLGGFLLSNLFSGTRRHYYDDHYDGFGGESNFDGSDFGGGSDSGGGGNFGGGGSDF
ncbi:TPM domain-containing protein [Fructobacillus americanaquae]|uniref:TPM domain-containing protein n=1 Tax=Fructobacillus americanaquae TaxID=2940302 RepID=A0ABY5BZ71_9LACO|nr:TPM domain-containing protein [Fructobacillus americanaquae]USS91647.1 TPM domain-containing protein [Fructobacillus americanaquae]